MGAAAVNVADVIVLELQAVNHPWRLGLGLFLSTIVAILGFPGGRLDLLRRRIAKNQNQLFAVGRPLEVLHILNRLGEALRLTALAIQHVDLGLLLVSLGILAR